MIGYQEDWQYGSFVRRRKYILQRIQKTYFSKHFSASVIQEIQEVTRFSYFVINKLIHLLIICDLLNNVKEIKMHENKYIIL